MQVSEHLVCEHSIHRLTITAVLLAAKLSDDRVYKNSLYAQVSTCQLRNGPPDGHQAKIEQSLTAHGQNLCRPQAACVPAAWVARLLILVMISHCLTGPRRCHEMNLTLACLVADWRCLYKRAESHGAGPLAEIGLQAHGAAIRDQ